MASVRTQDSFFGEADDENEDGDDDDDDGRLKHISDLEVDMPESPTKVDGGGGAEYDNMSFRLAADGRSSTSDGVEMSIPPSPVLEKSSETTSITVNIAITEMDRDEHPIDDIPEVIEEEEIEENDANSEPSPKPSTQHVDLPPSMQAVKEACLIAEQLVAKSSLHASSSGSQRNFQSENDNKIPAILVTPDSSEPSRQQQTVEDTQHGKAVSMSVENLQDLKFPSSEEGDLSDRWSTVSSTDQRSSGVSDTDQDTKHSSRNTLLLSPSASSRATDSNRKFGGHVTDRKVGASRSEIYVRAMSEESRRSLPDVKKLERESDDFGSLPYVGGPLPVASNSWTSMRSDEQLLQPGTDAGIIMDNKITSESEVILPTFCCLLL
jgi:hypothetical protein